MAGDIDLAWDPVPGAMGYRVFYGTSPNGYPNFVEVLNGQTSTTLSGLTDCQSYYVAVKAFNSAGESPQYSNQVSGWSQPQVQAVPTVQTAQGNQFTLNIDGNNFDPAASVVFDTSSLPQGLGGSDLVRFESVSVISCNQVQMLVTVETLARGFRAMEVGSFPIDVEVLNPGNVRGVDTFVLDVSYDPERSDVNRSDQATQDRVDGQDLTWLAFAHGTVEGDSRFNPDADLNGDGMVDGIDLAQLAPDFGRCWNGGAWAACP